MKKEQEKLIKALDIISKMLEPKNCHKTSELLNK